MLFFFSISGYVTMKRIIPFLRKTGLYMRGLDLQRVYDISQYREFRKAVFETVENTQICFTFYLKEMPLYRYRAGLLQTLPRLSYAIKITLPQNAPAMLKKFENMCFICHVKKHHNEDYLCRLLLSFFISYISITVHQ